MIMHGCSLAQIPLKRRARFKNLGVLSLALLPACLTFPDGAQAEAVMEEVVVTSQRRAEDVQDINIAISVLDGSAIGALGISESIAIDNQIPNLIVDEVAGSGTQPIVFLRGVGLNDFSLNNSGPIAIYYDDVYLSSFSSQNFMLYDIERVEVLRGPQGTLYGRNATGGAINYLSNKPEDFFSGYLTAGIGSYNARNIEGAVGGPITDTIKGRIAMARKVSDGFFENTLTNTDSNGADAWSAKTMLQIDPRDELSMLLRFRVDSNSTPFSQYERIEVLDAVTSQPCSLPDIKAGICVDALGYQDTTSLYKGSFNREEDIDRNVYGLSLNTSWDFEFSTLTSVTSYEWGDNYLPEESDASPNQLLEITLGADTKTFTQEFRLSGSTDLSKYIIGAYFLTEEVEQDQTADVFRELRPLVNLLSPINNPGGFDPGGLVAGAPIFYSRTRNDQDTDAYAVFGQFDWQLTDQLSLTAGLRYTKEDKEFNSVLVFEEPGFTVPGFDAERTFSDEDVSGKLAVNYALDDDSLFYASASKGFKSGGFNGGYLFSEEELVPFDSEILYSYEMGFKTTFFDRRARFNTAAFYYDYQDLQVYTLLVSGGIPVSTLSNAANATVSGLEAELVVVPTENLFISMGLGYLESEIKDFESLGQDFSGNELARTPELSFNALVSYDFVLTGGAVITPQIDASYTGDHYFSTENDPLAQQDAYWIANMRLGYVSPDERYEVAMRVNNLFDEEYNVNINSLRDFGFYQVVVGAPRSWGLEMKVTF